MRKGREQELQTVNKNQQNQSQKSIAVRGSHQSNLGFDHSDQHSAVSPKTPEERERTLRVIDNALSRIEHIMDGMRAEERTPAAFEEFMAALAKPLRRAGDSIRVKDNVTWVKIEGKNGHKVYISKGKKVVGRVDSTLPSSMIPGAKPAEKYNGKIITWLPATVRAVSLAIELLSDPTLPAPVIHH